MADIKDLAIVACTEATPDHNKGTGTDATETAQSDHIQHIEATAAEPTMTLNQIIPLTQERNQSL